MDRTTLARIAGMALLLAALVITGCAAPASDPGGVPAEPTTGAAPPADGGAAGTRLAAGLYDQPDGTVLAIGTLEWRDIEGGFWAVTGGTEAEGDAGKVAAVLAGIAKDDPAYAPLSGRTVQVAGTRIKGASVRMAGPEIAPASIAEISDTGGAAQ